MEQNQSLRGATPEAYSFLMKTLPFKSKANPNRMKTLRKKQGEGPSC